MVTSRPRVTRSLPLLVLSLLLVLPSSCGKEAHTAAPSEPLPARGAGADPTPGDTGGAGAEDLPERPERHLGTVSIRGTVLDGRIFGELEAGARVRVDLLYASGARPADLRVWIGSEEAGQGAVTAPEVVDKPKLHRALWTLDSAPQEGDRLWLEFTAPGNNVARGSLALR